ncbi:precorrin-6Y C5,15-methyltransferase (decarboxylating) subunit CbiT [Phycicoccus flavus]|uniref:Precorrin-6Y C5,15-methyltransferase (Decarboxylating) subunit CbiT n=1 Tax=Phycicoccus flavus TaxID=2502783 RepID=A0A8T6R1C8_9MICO|nr:precorrin-6Y C5,15-methyltransferase (decarboxylating) subunit CbiT [Phycicoccus flavus]NHA67300.1 precorrin-6Y C5,15-methyltransferase (decarboxylating) subunit CbiT [Phycicoccus flavus]
MIDVIGVPAEGPQALPPATRAVLRGARTVLGSPRLLGLLGPEDPADRRPWPAPLSAGLPGLLEDLPTIAGGADGPGGVVALASGDPLVSGIGTTLVRVLGADAVRVHPAVSSVALARARMRWSAEESQVVGLVSAAAGAIRPWLAPGARLLVLSATEATPREVAAVLVADGCGAARLTVLGDLGAAGESRVGTTADALLADPTAPLPRLHVLAVEVPSDAVLPGRAPGLPDDAFAHDGQLTKAELRALAVAALRPLPGQVLWDLGAGAGSVSVEWCRLAPGARAVAVERDPTRAERVAANAAAHGVPVRVVRADVADAVADAGALPAPDAVFVGGGATDAVVEAAWAALPPGGRLVVPAVTLGTEALVVAAHARHGGTLRRFTVERAEPLGRHLSWTPARPVVQWAATRPADVPPTPAAEETP